MSVFLSAGKQILYSNLFTLTAFIQKILAAVVRQQHLARQVEYLIEFISPICIYLFQCRCDNLYAMCVDVDCKEVWNEGPRPRGRQTTCKSLKHSFYKSYDLWRPQNIPAQRWHKRLLRKHINCIFTTIQPQHHHHCSEFNANIIFIPKFLFHHSLIINFSSINSQLLVHFSLCLNAWHWIILTAWIRFCSEFIRCESEKLQLIAVTK